MVTADFTSKGDHLPNGFGIYLHVPFCVHKCSYCDFYSFTQYAKDDFQAYAERMCREIEEASQWLRRRAYDRIVTSIFIGGGTPSLLPPVLTGKILQRVYECFPVAEAVEVTSEANPETVNLAFVQELKAFTPINRISLGAQSFSAENLKKLERLGSRESIHQAVAHLKAGGFTNFNLDLIFAIPGQEAASMLSDIAEVAQLGPTHVSGYNLTLKPGHPLFKQLPTDDAVADLYERAVLAWAEHGYAQYEISNYARLGSSCAHNLLYWSGGDFLGLGTSAASRFFWDGVFHHRKQYSDYSKYMKGNLFDEIPFEKTTSAQTILEATFLELRRNSGIDLLAFNERYGSDPSCSKNYSLFLKEGLLLREGSRLSLTGKGRLLADLVTERLTE